MQRSNPENRRYVDALVQLQHSTIEIVALAIALALGINLFSSGLAQWINLSGAATTLFGVALIAVGFSYLFLKAKPALSRSIKMKGVLPISRGGEVVELSRYRFSEEMRSYVRAVAAENKAMERTWQRARFGVFGEQGTNANERAEEEGNRMVREAVEYFVLSKLSLHLSAYFTTDRAIHSDAVTTVLRRNIPQLLLDNRFLELFSKPMHERAAFQSEEDDEREGTVVFATGEDGELFDQFELILPLGTVLDRTEDGALSIKTDRFTIQLNPVFDRFSTVFPRDFEKSYLGMNFSEVHAHAVYLKIDIAFNWRSITTRKGWDYYHWLDSFIEDLDRSFSFDEFIEEIGWHTAHTVAITMKNSSRTKNKF
ncbi:hypothetical protein [Rhodoferax saidenbachensis]|uniref:DUF3137 domain-containing protein n=1 Tax=Rhodoferax saidenbachensis TaxID=1484693 RepID=A0ABU1ZKJ8_9BURK|nr:hypothetical protein [Rhodoferax saidenbachensis]MDR7306077.1 hypothetical protein [Rhodoferax saidenbachensis]